MGMLSLKKVCPVCGKIHDDTFEFFCCLFGDDDTSAKEDFLNKHGYFEVCEGCKDYKEAFEICTHCNSPVGYKTGMYGPEVDESCKCKYCLGISEDNLHDLDVLKVNIVGQLHENSNLVDLCSDRLRDVYRVVKQFNYELSQEKKMLIKKYSKCKSYND